MSLVDETDFGGSFQAKWKAPVTKSATALWAETQPIEMLERVLPSLSKSTRADVEQELSRRRR